jgi:hypothetical protein
MITQQNRNGLSAADRLEDRGANGVSPIRNVMYALCCPDDESLTVKSFDIDPHVAFFRHLHARVGASSARARTGNIGVPGHQNRPCADRSVSESGKRLGFCPSVGTFEEAAAQFF